MPTSSIFETVKIRDAREAEAFVRAVEESERLSKTIPVSSVETRMATKEDRLRLYEMRKCPTSDYVQRR